MVKVLVFYYSSTGNTEQMAKAIVEGVKSMQGVDVELSFNAKLEDLENSDAIIIGTPTYHHDTTRSMKRLFEKAAVNRIDLNGKIGASFGSYGWSGEAPRIILEIMENKFGMKIIKPPLLIKYAPDESGIEECYNFGKRVAQKL